MTQMNLFTKQKQIYRHREQNSDCQGGGGWVKNGLGVLDYQMQIIMHKMDKQ